MSTNLSVGSIQAIWNGQTPAGPIVQVIDCRKVTQNAPANTPDRYRLIISDSIHYQQAMLATQLNGLVTNNNVSNRCVIKLNEYLCNPVHNKKIIILLGLEVLTTPLSHNIGSPVSVESGSPSSTPPQSNPSSAPNPNPNVRASIPTSGAPPQQANYSPPSMKPTPGNSGLAPNSSPVQLKPMPTSNPVHHNSSMGAPVPQRSQPLQAQPHYTNGHPLVHQPVNPPQPQQTWQPPSPGPNRMPASNPPMTSSPPGHQYSSSPQGVPNYGQPPSSPEHIAPITSLNPYKHRWTIKAKVTAKSEIKTWSNARGDGKLASVDLLDKQGGQIRATMFQETVDRLYNVFELNKIYMISKGAIKAANKKFSTLPNEWEVTFNNETIVQPCELESDANYRIKCDYKPIAEIQNLHKDDPVDVVGIVTETNAATPFMSKAGKETSRRVIKIADQTHSIEITLWGPQAENPGWQEFEHPVISVSGATVSEFNNRSLSCLRSCVLEVNPNVPEAQNLQAWYDLQGGRVNPSAMTFNPKKKTNDDPQQPLELKTFAQVKAEQLGISEQQNFLVKGTINIMKRENGSVLPWYYACPTKTCGGKKATYDATSNTYHCAKCNESVTTPDVRYLLSFSVADHTGSSWVGCFNEVGNILLGKKAPEMAYMKDHDPQLYERTWGDATFRQCYFRMKATPDSYQGEAKARMSVMGVEDINFVQESNSLIAAINQYNMM